MATKEISMQDIIYKCLFTDVLVSFAALCMIPFLDRSPVWQNGIAFVLKMAVALAFFLLIALIWT